MSVLVKVLIFLGGCLLFGALGVIIYNQINLSKQQTAIQQQVLQQKTLVDGLVQSANTYTTKDDLNNFIQQNTNDLKAIQSNLSGLGAQITAANVVSANSSGQVVSNLPSSGQGTLNPTPPTPTTVQCPSGGSVECPVIDPFGYQKAAQTLNLNEDFPNLQVPFGNVSFSAFKAQPWDLDILPRQYKITSVIGTDENQRVYVDNKFTIQAGDKTYTVPITTDQTQQVYPSPKFSWWNPRLFLTAGSAVNFSHIAGDVNLGAAVGVMSYGKFLNSPDISVLQLGLGYQFIDKSPTVIINPVSFNIGHLVSNGLINNTFLGPSLQVDFKGGLMGGGNLSVGF
jgi:hypothetical protein